MDDLVAELEASLARERAAREEAEQANRSKNQFLAAISHELRAPLTTLLVWERLLREHGADPELRARALDAIHESVAQQSRLVADLLDGARASTGRLRVELAPIELRPVLDAAFERARLLAPAKAQRFEREIADDLGAVRADAARLSQVLDNLLANAIKFTPAAGTITLTARLDGRSIVIEVADTGCGIASDQLPHIFEPFSDASEGRGGLGLGLSLARQLVLLHHGTLVAASDGPETGARFTLRIPRADTTAPPPALPGIRILLIDDDPLVLDALQLLLERASAHVVIAAGADAAWAVLEREPVDAIVSDIAMPGEDGYHLIRRIRAGAAFRGIPAIALTAHASLSDRRDALAAGFDLHVAKPVDIDGLIGAIAQLVRAYQMQH